VERHALFESAGRWAVTSRRTLASEAIVRSSGPRPSFDDGWDLATCSGLEKGHLRDLRFLRGRVIGVAMPSCLCVFVFAMSMRGSASSLCLCVSVVQPGWDGWKIRNSKFEIRNPKSHLLGGNLQFSLHHLIPQIPALPDR